MKFLMIIIDYHHHHHHYYDGIPFGDLFVGFLAVFLRGRWKKRIFGTTKNRLRRHVQRGHVERVRRLLDGVVVEHVAEVHVLRQHVVCDGQEELGRAVGRAGGARIRASGQPNVSAPRAAQAPAPARRRRRRDRQSSWRRRGS